MLTSTDFESALSANSSIPACSTCCYSQHGHSDLIDIVSIHIHLLVDDMVRWMGIEPMQPCLKGRCSTNWAIITYNTVDWIKRQFNPTNRRCYGQELTHTVQLIQLEPVASITDWSWVSCLCSDKSLSMWVLAFFGENNQWTQPIMIKPLTNTLYMQPPFFLL